MLRLAEGDGGESGMRRAEEEAYAAAATVEAEGDKKITRVQGHRWDRRSQVDEKVEERIHC